MKLIAYIPHTVRPSCLAVWLLGLSVVAVLRPLSAQVGGIDSLRFLLDVPLTIDGKRLANPWAGGLNAPQFSHIDLDGDGLQDLLVFDRRDQMPLPFKHYPADPDMPWRFAPQYIGAFPRMLYQNWMLARDWNGDGKADLFTNQVSNIAVFTHSGYSPNGPIFSRYPDTLLLTNYTTSRSLLYSASIDIPGLADIDGDGDLDILVYDVTGTAIEYHRNMALEFHGRTDTLDLYLRTTCWGHFIENYDFSTGEYEIYLGTQGCWRRSFKTAHVGGSILPIQLNGDTLIDAIVGDNGNPGMAAVYNGGKRDSAAMLFADEIFPANDRAVQVPYFPAGYQIDVQGDGKRDLIVAPNEAFGGNDNAAVWYYANQGSDLNPEFVLQDTAWLQNTMLDLGTGTAPTWIDYNADGKPDLLIGNRYRWIREGLSNTSLTLLKNVGSADSLAFELVTRDYLFLGSTPGIAGLDYLHPHAVDLDGDGDHDLLLGVVDAQGRGAIWYFENTAAPGQEARMTLRSSDYLGLRAQGIAGPPILRAPAPATYDLDGDGDLDLVIGHNNGQIWAFENRGDSQTPDFQFMTYEWGGVDVKEVLVDNFIGAAHPALADLDGDGQPELLVGNLDGRVWVYQNPSLDSGAVFQPLGTLMGLDLGGFIRPALFNLGTLDSAKWVYALGCDRGGLMLLAGPAAIVADTTDSIPGNTSRPEHKTITFEVWPNPANVTDQIWISTSDAGVLRVLNLMGQAVMQTTLQARQMTTLNLGTLPPGVYTLLLETESAQLPHRRLILQP